MSKTKTIVFLRDTPKSRIYNQAYALKKTKKYKLILLTRNFDDYNLSIFRQVFDKIICYQPSILDLKKIGFAQKSDDSSIVHTFKVLITDHTIDPIIKKLSYSVGFTSLFKKIHADLYNSCGADELTYFALKNSNKPVVMDLHNGSIMHGIENLSKENFERDKFCYENIGGIIHRGPDIEIEYYKNHGYNITCPILNFFDYCNRDFFVNKQIKKLSSEDGEPHLVNIGSGMQSTNIPKMLRSFFKQKIHMHIYLVPYSTIWNVYQQYVKLDKNEKYFHLHDTLPFNKIQEDIAKYDFGAIIRPTEVMDSYTPEAMKIAARSYRQYNFLEAGLPIIINDRLEYYAKIVEDNKIGFSVKNKELANLRKKIKMYNYDELRKNVLKAREKFLIDKHIKRLDNYYDSLLVEN